MEDTFFEFPSEKMDRSVMMTARVKGELSNQNSTNLFLQRGGVWVFMVGGAFIQQSAIMRVMRALLNKGVSMVSVSCQKRWLTKCLPIRLAVLTCLPESSIKALSNDFDMGFGSSGKWGLGFLLIQRARKVAVVGAQPLGLDCLTTSGLIGRMTFARFCDAGPSFYDRKLCLS